MPLQVAEIIDLRDVTKEFVASNIAPAVDENNNDTSDGQILSIKDGKIGSTYTIGVYDHIRDRYITQQHFPKNDPDTGSRQLYGGHASRDALMRDGTDGWWVPDTFDPGGPGGGDSFSPWGGQQSNRYILGQPNLQNSSQTLFYYGNVDGRWNEINMSTGVNIATGDSFPNILENMIGADPSVAADGTTFGWWDVDSDVTPGQLGYNCVLFDGMTDTTGYDQETDSEAGILLGGNSHPKGLLLVRSTRSTLFDDSNPTGDTGARWLWVDADTGLCVGVLGIEPNANSSSSNRFAGPSINGLSFNWQYAQFVPDPETSFGQPKGELHIFASFDSSFGQSNQTIEAPEQTFTSDTSTQFVTVWEFNPFGLNTGTVRVHNRKTFTGIIQIPFQPIIEGGQDCTANNGQGNLARSPAMYYHPPSRTYCSQQYRSFDAPARGTDMPQVGYSRLIRWRRASVIDTLTPPTPDDAVTDNRVIQYKSIAQDDFNQRAPGVTVTFSIDRRSTRAESFDGTAQGSSAYVVEAGEIDDDNRLDVREGNDFDNSGTLLTEGVDYNVTYSTGTLTPIGSWPTDTIFVRYRHRDVGLTPSHGTLLTTTTVTDENGVAEALVDYGDNLEGELDRLQVTDQ